ncbi:lysoplasmalogenase [bacterium]|nr:lysoplasmalogenase [bacterium]
MGFNRTGLWAYIGVSTAVLTGIVLENDALYMATKPLLMVSLLAYYWGASGEMQGRKWVVLALVFSWFGDAFLMAEWGFMPGLGSFLVAHLCFSKAYWMLGAEKGSVKPVDVVKFIVVGAGLMWVLFPGLGSMFIPVLIYAIVLLGMAVVAHKRRGATSPLSFSLVAAGAVFFVMSDGLIAVNKFAYDVPFERLLVMSTYILAQYLIVTGLLKHSTD